MFEMVDDSRKSFILTTTANYFGLERNSPALSTSGKLDSFLDDGNEAVLAARYERREKKVHITSTVEPGDTNDKVLVFFKLTPSVITPDNLHDNVFVSSMLDSPVTALYHAVQKVFAPLLLQNDKFSRHFDPKLQSLLSELEAGLASVVRQKGFSGLDDGSFTGILTPADEIQFWAEAMMSGSKLDARERAGHFQELLQPVSKGFTEMNSLSLTDAVELVEVTRDTLDDVWKQLEHNPPYQEPRMRHFLDVVGSSFVCYLQRKLGELDLWHGPYQLVKDGLQIGQTVCEKWSTATEQLTSQWWKRFSAHPWKGEKHVADTMIQLGKRLEEIATLRTVHEHLLRLLSAQEQQEFQTTHAFTPFAGLNPLQYNPYTQPMWTAAMKRYEKSMAPAEGRIANMLRQQFRDIRASPHQVGPLFCILSLRIDGFTSSLLFCAAATGVPTLQGIDKTVKDQNGTVIREVDL